MPCQVALKAPLQQQYQTAYMEATEDRAGQCVGTPMEQPRRQYVWGHRAQLVFNVVYRKRRDKC